MNCESLEFFPFAKLDLDLYLENVDSIDLEEKKKKCISVNIDLDVLCDSFMWYC